MSFAGFITVALLNAIGSFVVASVVAMATLALLRLRDGRLRVLVLCLPFGKLVFDLLRSLPHILPVGQKITSQEVRFGLGLAEPMALHLRLFMLALVGDEETTMSLGDLVVQACQRANPMWVSVLAAALVLPALALIGRRALAYLRFERGRRRRRCNVMLVEQVRLRLRTVDVVESPDSSGVPYSGGLLRPYICIPSSLASELSRTEYRAVIEHELAHVRYFDLLLRVSIGVLTDVFWFVPGIRSLAHRIAFACEQCADDAAVNNGVSCADLASALVRVAESMRAAPSGPVMAAGQGRSQLRKRVERLLAPKRGRSLVLAIARWAVVALAVQSVFLSVFGGYIPEWKPTILHEPKDHEHSYVTTPTELSESNFTARQVRYELCSLLSSSECATPPRASVHLPSGTGSCTITLEEQGTFPLAVYGASAVAYNGSFYVVGGSAVDAEESAHRSSMVAKWTPETRQIKVISRSLMPRRYGAAVVHDGGMYVVGGQGERPGVLGTLERLDLTTHEISTLAPMPTARSFTGAAMFDGRLFVAGGRLDDKIRTAVVEIYDLQSDRWWSAAPLGQARDTKLVVAAGSLYALGGYDGKRAVTMVERWVPQRGEWEAVAQMSAPTSAYASTSIGNMVLTFGDYEDQDRVQRYDARADTWEAVPLRFSPRRHGAAASSGNHIFVFGGNRASRWSFRDTYEVYAVSCSAGPLAASRNSAQTW